MKRVKCLGLRKSKCPEQSCRDGYELDNGGKEDKISLLYTVDILPCMSLALLSSPTPVGQFLIPNFPLQVLILSASLPEKGDCEVARRHQSAGSI